jgi:cytoskeleton protein RodZ
VSSTPPGAEVLVDEFPLPGVTPIESAPVTARPSRTIRIELEGYEPYEEEFDLTQDRNLSFFLTPVTAAEAPQETAGEAAATTEATAQEEAGGGAEGEATLTITEDTWLEVYRGTSRNQGARLAFMTARAGQSFSYELPIYIHVGNAGGVELTVEGQDRGVLGSSGEVRGLVVTD